MSSADVRIVLVGAGQCSASAASTLRSRGFDGQIMMIGAEAEPPYERPPLSKGYLLGETGAAELYVRPADWYADNDIDLMLACSLVSVMLVLVTQLISDVGYAWLNPRIRVH